jgi:quinol monooxygenase YgiN
MALPHIADMLKWLGSGTVLEGDAKVKMNLTYVEDFFFTRPELKDAKDPFVLVAEIEYKPDAIPGTMPYWKAVFEEVRSSEPGTLTYAIASDKDAGNENTLYAIEAYESKDYLWNVHAKGTALQSSMTDTKHLRNDVKHNFLKVAGGFLTKG